MTRRALKPKAAGRPVPVRKTPVGRRTPPNKAWAGRFTKGPDARAEVFASSLQVDLVLLPYDIQGSQAHVRMLGACGIVTPAEAKRIEQGLGRVLAQWQQGRLTLQPTDEDVHMLVERCLYSLIGPVAGKLHTGRSRNDQVITDVKLYLRDRTERLMQELLEVQRSLLRLAEAHEGWIMPGYTHLQVAQPVWVAHWLLAHLEAFRRDAERLATLRRGSLDELPLGSAALAGTSHPIDRQVTAKWLGFSRVTANSMDTVADRDFCIEFASAAALCGVHLSRLGEELVVFSSAEFGFVTLDQGFATGSSIMPQKRNPDIAELLRGKAGRLHGNLTTLLTLLKGLPLTYNRDLQEDKEAVFDSADTLSGCLGVLAPMLDSLTFHQERMAQACGRGFPTATEAADHLVREGVPFREAHEAVGRAVTHASQSGRGLEQWTLADWRRFHPSFQAGIVKDVALEKSVAVKRSWGGTAPERVRAAMKRERARLFSPAKKYSD